MTKRRYSELIRIPTFAERFEYLALGGTVGRATFGHERYLNQRFYTSREWKRVRRNVIARDLGLDLAAEGFEISDRITVHHMNPMSISEVEHGSVDILDPEYLITTQHYTHNAIHYGDASLLPKDPVERRAGDTLLW